MLSKTGDTACFAMSNDSSDTPRSTIGEVTDRPAPAESMPSGPGTIRHYQVEKGFGFIARFGEPDVFFHVIDLVDGQFSVEIGDSRCDPAR